MPLHKENPRPTGNLSASETSDIRHEQRLGYRSQKQDHPLQSLSLTLAALGPVIVQLPFPGVRPGPGLPTGLDLGRQLARRGVARLVPEPGCRLRGQLRHLGLGQHARGRGGRRGGLLLGGHLVEGEGGVGLAACLDLHVRGKAVSNKGQGPNYEAILLWETHELQTGDSGPYGDLGSRRQELTTFLLNAKREI